MAVVAEIEDGSVVCLTYVELKVGGLGPDFAILALCAADRVGLLMENGVEATTTLFRLTYIGAIVVPMFSGFGSDAIVSRVSSCGTHAIIAPHGFHRRGRLIETAAVIHEARAAR
ncbi:AMP-binding protein [Bradyrhizobium sp. AZCC 2289]|uniref:AMP-binding protein n=1 Tax=Bradyrhizobium sp. AZCC 2289 TaxID=3117026 RepID=UPI002FF19307